MLDLRADREGAHRGFAAIMKLESGQVAVVTGGASGIGRALADAFVARGLAVVLADVREDTLEEAGGALRAGGAEVLTKVVDVRSADAVQALADATIERFGRVDVVCNNAGIVGPWAPMWDLTLDDWSWALEVHLWGVINGVRSFVPLLVAAGHGHVLNTASMAGLGPLVGNAPYCAAKHAIVGLTETLRNELRLVDGDVGASVLCPSLVPTNVAASSRNRPADRRDAALTVDFRDPNRRSAGMMSAQDVAAVTLDGIEANKLLIIPAPGSTEIVRDRFEALLAP